MHRRRASQNTNQVYPDDASASAPNPGHLTDVDLTTASSPSTNGAAYAGTGVSLSPSSSAPTQRTAASSKRVRAASSALATIAIDSGLDSETPSRNPTPPPSSSSRMVRPSMSSPLPSYQRSSSTRPGSGSSMRLVSRFSFLFSLLFLALTTVFLLFPTSRERGKAAVSSIGGYAGHAWEAAGTGWDSWRQTHPGAAQGAAGVAPATSSINNKSVRVMPPAHPDLTKTTRCEQSFDGKHAVVQYAIMIDAGSTGSRVHVYKFNYCSSSPELEDEVFEMLRPGLSSFKGNPRGAADSLRPLLQTSLKSIPQALQGCTPIAVKATAGLRLLGQEESNKILKEVRRMIRDEYPFVLADGPATKGVVELTPGGGEIEGKAVEIMDGRDEGVFAWITVNYLLGFIGPPLPGQSGGRRQTAAVMDLGGASTQIVFEPAVASDPVRGMRPGEHVYALRNFGGSGQDYTLYQNSYLGYGLMQARRRVNSLAAFAYGYTHPQGSNAASRPRIPSPCFAPGMSKTTKIATLHPGSKDDVDVEVFGAKGGISACRRLVDVMLDKDADCKEDPCSFAGVYQPKLLDAVTSSVPSVHMPGVVALSYFYDRLYPLGLGHDGQGFTLAELESVATDVCAGPSHWASKFSSEGLAELRDRPETCLDLVYMHSLLSLGYDLESKNSNQQKVQLRIEKKLGGIELGWALGAAVGMLGEMEGSRGICKRT